MDNSKTVFCGVEYREEEYFYYITMEYIYKVPLTTTHPRAFFLSLSLYYSKCIIQNNI